MANKPYYGVNPAYNSNQTNEMVMGIPGAMTDATVNMLKKAKTGLGNVWNSMDTTSKAATVAGLVPGYGDIAGVANDARLFYQNPEMRTPINYGLSAAGLIPGIPSMVASMGMVKGMGKGIAGSIVPPVDVVKSIKPKPIKAPASDVGFYSPTEKAALNLNRNQGSGQSFLNDLKKGENVKGDELTYTELEDWLKTKPNLTKQEVQDYIANNKLDIQESYLDDSGNIWTTSGLNDTHYAEYQLPNGDNYREILLTLPQKIKTLPEGFTLDAYVVNGKTKYGIYDLSRRRYGSGNTKQEAFDQFNEGGYGEIENYESSHWDEPNVLAHIRTNQRLDINGKKTTLIEEVQSDWHQSGREKGYATDTKPQRDKIQQEREILLNKQDEYLNLAEPYTSQGKDAPQNIIEGWTNVQDKLQELQRQEDKINITKGEVPDAPFKEDWYKLALKRAIKEAVDNGSDSISLTTGSRQAERWNLSKQVDEIISMRNEDGTFNLSATMPFGGQKVSIGNNISADKLQNYVGKDLAISMQKQDIGGDVYSGDSLKVGGEGMKKYYDEIYPAFLNKFGKKYGVKVEDNIIDIGKPEKIYTLPITPQMREDVLKGQPLTDKNEQDKNQYYA